MDLGNLFRQLVLGQDEPSGPPQAYTRVTHTPIKWGSLSGNTFGQYQPDTGNITMNRDKLPQHNPDPEYLSNILRHESVHALLPPNVIQSLMGYLGQNPQYAATGQQNLSRVDPQAASTVKGFAQEAPAYAVQGYRFGLPEEVLSQFINRMPEGIRQKYLLLLRGGGR